LIELFKIEELVVKLVASCVITEGVLYEVPPLPPLPPLLPLPLPPVEFTVKV